MNILIIDDDRSFALELKIMFEEWGHQTVDCVSSLSEFWVAIKKTKYDAFTVDFALTGGDKSSDLMAYFNEKLIDFIIITSYKDDSTFKEISFYNPLSYFTKPIDNVSLKYALQKIEKGLSVASATNQDFKIIGETKDIYIKKSGKYHKVKLEEIYYIEADGNHVTIITNTTKFVVRCSLKRMREQLDSSFIQTHRNLLVNIEHIIFFDSNTQLITVGRDQLSVGRKFKGELLKVIKNKD